MTALDFPSSPANGDSYSKYRWDGEKWLPAHTWVMPTPATFDGAVTNVVMSNGNLTATYNGSGLHNGTRSTAIKSSGKYYFEITVGAHSSTLTDKIGILLSTASYIDFSALNAGVAAYNLQDGSIYGNNAYSGKFLGVGAVGNVIGVAADFDNRKTWFRQNGGNWNGLAIGSENPATNTGGVTFATGSFSPALFFNSASGDTLTGNFGATAFGTAAPSGFTGWTA